MVTKEDVRKMLMNETEELTWEENKDKDKTMHYKPHIIVEFITECDLCGDKIYGNAEHICDLSEERSD